MDGGSLKRKRREEPDAAEKRLKIRGWLSEGEWVRGPMLGKGGFGSVYLVIVNKPDCEFLAMKSSSGSRNSELLASESALLNMFRECPFVIDTYGYEFTVDDDGIPICNMYMEYAKGGTLGDLVMEHGAFGLKESLVRKYTECILKGIEHIHYMEYAHCDIKPDNILIVTDPTNSSDFVPKIADVGLAKWDKSGKQEKKSYWRGTPMYLSPEAVNDIQGKPSDIWALGCVVLEMLTGKHPWVEVKPDAQFPDLKPLISSKTPYIPHWLSKDAKDFLGKCFLRDPTKRSTASDLLKHPFLSKIDEVIPIEVERLKEAFSKDLEAKYWDPKQILPLKLLDPHGEYRAIPFAHMGAS